MQQDLRDKLEQAVWIACSLYNRGKTAGSSANLSFRHENGVYITASGTCFGNLTIDDFAYVPDGGTAVGPRKPSKELELHRCLYDKGAEIGAVIHTHSTYATLLSILPHADGRDVIPGYTPYLEMKLGKVVSVPYAKPGSCELFAAMRAAVGKENGYLLRNHGPIVGDATLMDAYYAIEELEESARIAWLLRDIPGAESLRID